MCSRRVSISGVAPENSSTTPDRNTRMANTGAASPEAALIACWATSKRRASLASSSTQASSSGSTT
ncbi:hypothetical protein D3C80_2060090 [compost metagenome]